MHDNHPSEAATHKPDALDHLELLTYDAYLHEMNEKADDIEWQLKHSMPMSADSLVPEISAVKMLRLRQQLDSEWLYINQEVTAVAGRVMIPEQSDNAGLPSYQIETIDHDEILTSTGFMFVALADSAPSDKPSLTYKVAYAFMREGQQCAIMRDEFVGVFPDTSYEMAEKRLFYHHRKEVECINERLSRSETPTILDFTDYQLGVLMYARYNENFVGDIETYMYEALQFDQALPYYVVYGDDDKQVSCLARPEKIIVLPVTDDDTESPRLHRPYVQLSIYGATPQDSNVRVHVPIASLRQFTSLREPPRSSQQD